jgi:hypothetical protein
VDWSGARDAGRRLWVASGEREGARFRLQSLRPATALPEGGLDARAAFRALRALVRANPGDVFGVDAPLGLPAEVTGPGPWSSRIGAILAAVRDAEELRRRCGERRRMTDSVERAPMAPGNLRLFRQTWSALACFALPLVRTGAARVVPAQSAQPGRAWLLEVCPAVHLAARGWRVPYKGPGAGRRAGRAGIVEALVAAGELSRPSAAARKRMLTEPGGDALDAVIAAVAAAGVLAAGGPFTARHRGEQVEGRILTAPVAAAAPRTRRRTGDRGEATAGQRVRR